MYKRAQHLLEQGRSIARSGLGREELEEWPRWTRWLVQLVRAVRATSLDLAEGRVNLWAMSLVYTTLLSIVPLLAVSISVLKGFGVHNQIEPVLHGYLAPLGDRADDATRQVMEFVDNVRVGVLGAAGLALLFYTVISLTQKIERAFNEIWRASESRPLGERLARHLSVLLVGPVVAFVALGMTASAANNAIVQWLMGIDPLGGAVMLGLRLAPFVLVIATFAVLYRWIPNTHVRLGPALGGAVFAGVAWETAGLAFASFVGTSGRYDAIYSGFALMILFMLWTYASWLVLLSGASLAHYLQHPDRAPDRGVRAGRDPERLALRVAGAVAEAFETGEPPRSPARLAERLHVPLSEVETCLDRLREGGLLIASNAKPPGYLPRRAPESIRVDEILGCVQPGLATPGRASRPTHENGHAPRSGIDDLVDRMRHARAAIVDELTMKDLAELGSTGASACKAHKEHAPSGSTDRSEPYRSESSRSDTPSAADLESGERGDGPQLAKPGAEVTQDRYPPPSVARAEPDEPDERPGIRSQMRRVLGGSDEQS